MYHAGIKESVGERGGACGKGLSYSVLKPIYMWF